MDMERELAAEVWPIVVYLASPVAKESARPHTLLHGHCVVTMRLVLQYDKLGEPGPEELLLVGQELRLAKAAKPASVDAREPASL
jgi:hypothetical protein